MKMTWVMSLNGNIALFYWSIGFWPTMLKSRFESDVTIWLVTPNCLNLASGTATILERQWSDGNSKKICFFFSASRSVTRRALATWPCVLSVITTVITGKSTTPVSYQKSLTSLTMTPQFSSPYLCPSGVRWPKGPFINDVTQIWRISDPPPHSVTLKCRFYLGFHT